MSLSTHVLDTTHGLPASGMRVRLLSGEALVIECATNADGRCLEFKELRLESGCYRLEFEVATYFRKLGVVLPTPPFLDVVRVDFGMASSDGHYHVPLLVSPFGYSTYRGS